MKNDDGRFERFLDLARRGRPAEVPESRFGFATRVAARWAAHDARPDALVVWERLTRWGLAGALAVCLTVFLVSRDSLQARETPSALDAFAGFTEEDDSF
jgi:hypothetical protein